MNIPAFIYAGDTVKWSEAAIADRPAATWTMTLVVKHATGSDALTVNGVANSSGGWDFTLTATQTAGLHVNTHYWQIYVTSGSERYTIDQGSIQVKANIASGSNSYDGRTQAELDLAGVQAEIRARVSGGASLNYTIGSRSLAKEPISALIALESKLKADVAREKAALRIAKGLGSPRSIFARFGG